MSPLLFYFFTACWTHVLRLLLGHIIMYYYYRFYVIGLLLVGVVLIAKPPFLLKILFPHDNTLVTQVN